MDQTAIIIGQLKQCRRLEQQLDLLTRRPVILGWVLAAVDGTDRNPKVLGTVDELEPIVARLRPGPGVALVALPAAMGDLIISIRTCLRRLGVPDRFMPTLEDQLSGVGPRSRLDIDLAALLPRPPRRIDAAAVHQALAGKRVLITGAGGTIGSELARVVCGFDPAALVLIDRSENALFEIDRQIARRRPELDRRAVLHDVVDEEATLAYLRHLEPQIVLHAAAHKHVPMMEDHPALALDNNLFGTKSVVDATDAVGAERFVMISTDKAVNPRSIMGATKRLAELYVQSVNERSATACSIVRFGNVLGSTGSVLDVWSRELAEGGPLTVTDPKMTRYFMTISEAAALVVQAATLSDSQGSGGEIFVLDMGEPVLVLDLARRFIALHGLEVDRTSVPGTGAERAGTARIVFTGRRPGEKLSEELAFDTEALRPTSHPGIHLSSPPAPAPEFVERMVKSLASKRRSRDAATVAAAVRQFLPRRMEPAAA